MDAEQERHHSERDRRRWKCELSKCFLTCNPSLLKLLMNFVSVDKCVFDFSLKQSSTCRKSSISDVLLVENIRPNRVAFKVQSTNQARYLVRPNAGVIEARSTVKIVVDLHPLSDLPSPGQSKDKFLLLVSSYPGSGPVHEFGALHGKDSTIGQLKFRVTFDNNILLQPFLSFLDNSSYHSDISLWASVSQGENQQLATLRKSLLSCFCSYIVTRGDQEL